MVDSNGKYHSVSWGLYKPCTIVASEWEDNLYRLEAQNMLLSLTDSLVSVLIIVFIVYSLYY